MLQFRPVGAYDTAEFVLCVKGEMLQHTLEKNSVVVQTSGTLVITSKKCEYDPTVVTVEGFMGFFDLGKSFR